MNWWWWRCSHKWALELIEIYFSRNTQRTKKQNEMNDFDLEMDTFSAFKFFTFNWLICNGSGRCYFMVKFTSFVLFSSKPLWNEYHSCDIAIVRFNRITCISNEENFKRKTIENIYVREFLHVNYRATRKKHTVFRQNASQWLHFSELNREFCIIFGFSAKLHLFFEQIFSKLHWIENTVNFLNGRT